MKRLIFDIETQALPIEQILHLTPEFTAARNLKDPEKISADVAAKRVAWLDECALRAETCRVLCVGMIIEDTFACGEGDEAMMIGRLWKILDEQLMVGNEVVGFNCLGFDFPVLIRRSHILGVRVPTTIRRRHRGRAYWHEGIRDLMEEWTCGNREQRISLDNLAKALGVGAKNGSGKDFAALYAAEREKALEYLRNDCELIKLCAERML